MTDEKQNTKPLDLSRYDGHTPGPWKIGNLASWDGYTGRPYRNVWAGVDDAAFCIARSIEETDCEKSDVDANARLIADAPLLLAEVKRLRDRVDVLEREMYVVAKELESKSKFLDDDRAKRYCSLVVERALRIQRGDE